MPQLAGHIWESNCALAFEGHAAFAAGRSIGCTAAKYTRDTATESVVKNISSVLSVVVPGRNFYLRVVISE